MITNKRKPEPELMDKIPEWGYLWPAMDNMYSKGDTVKTKVDGKDKVCIIEDFYKVGSGDQRYKIRALNKDNV